MCVQPYLYLHTPPKKVVVFAQNVIFFDVQYIFTSMSSKIVHSIPLSPFPHVHHPSASSLDVKEA